MQDASRVSSRQDWDCEAALEQKADELRDTIIELEDELDTVEELLNHGNADVPVASVSHVCLDAVIGIVIVGIALGIFVLVGIRFGS